MKAIYFDMDGTLYDLYSVRDWESRLRGEDETAYCEGYPLGDMCELNCLLEDFITLGYIIGVITWTARDGSKEYNKRVRKVKRQWISDNLPCVSEFHCVKYGTPKHRVATYKNSMLVDDNAEVRHAWKNGATVDATNYDEAVRALRKILQIAIREEM